MKIDHNINVHYTLDKENNIIEKYFVKQNKKTGLYQRFDINGSVISKCYYDNDELNGCVSIYRNNNGLPYWCGVFKRNYQYGIQIGENIDDTTK